MPNPTGHSTVPPAHPIPSTHPRSQPGTPILEHPQCLESPLISVPPVPGIPADPSVPSAPSAWNPHHTPGSMPPGSHPRVPPHTQSPRTAPLAQTVPPSLRSPRCTCGTLTPPTEPLDLPQDPELRFVPPVPLTLPFPGPVPILSRINAAPWEENGWEGVKHLHRPHPISQGIS